MALNATIYRAALSIADLDRGYYADHALRIARHPSETEERMMVRLLAFALSAGERLAFGRGLSSEDEPDLQDLDDTGAIRLWIDVGLPEERRLRKACGRAERVRVIAFGATRADVWWQRNRTALTRLRNLEVLRVGATSSEALAALAQRDLRLAVTLQEGRALVSRADAAIEVDWETLKAVA